MSQSQFAAKRRGKRHKPSRAKLTNTRKAHRQALSSLSEVITMIKKQLQNTRTKRMARFNINCLAEFTTELYRVWTTPRLPPWNGQKNKLPRILKHFCFRLSSPWVPMHLLIQKYIKLRSHNGSQLSRCIIAKTKQKKK